MVKKNKLILLILLNCLVLTATFSAYNSLVGLVGQQDTTDSTVPLNTSVYYHFDPPKGKSVAPRPAAVAIGDVNNDGYNDFVTASTANGVVTIYLWNNITDSWVLSSYESVGRQPMDVFIEDANNDGYNDIITPNAMDDNVSVLIWNNITKNWNTQITKKVGFYPMSVCVGDANNDGYNDIVTANTGDNNISIILWNGVSHTWDKQITKWVGTEPNGIYIGDANNDGVNDIVTVNAFDDTASILLWNNTLSNWNSQVIKSTGGEPVRVTIADANNDGYKDIITANYADNNVSILVWNKNISNWNAQLLRAVGVGPQSIWVDDANNDGYNDIVTANYAGNTTSILFWDNNTANWASEVTLTGQKMPDCAAIGDVNNDNFNDIVISQWDNSSVSIILWNPAPKTPVLDFYGPHPMHHLTADGIVRLNWTAVEMVTKYYVYRDTSWIYNSEDIINLTPIAAVTAIFYVDHLTINDYYFYAIVAGNAIKNGSPSNCEQMHVVHPITAPTLSSPINTNGNIYLNWTPVATATIYSIHRDTKPITLNQSHIWTICIGFKTSTNFTDTPPEAGVYYYAIVASDGHVYNISNNVSVEIEAPIPGFEPLITLFALILIAFVFIAKRSVLSHAPKKLFSI